MNCHATTETSDLLGGLRPVRGRSSLEILLREEIQVFTGIWSKEAISMSVLADPAKVQASSLSTLMGAVRLLWKTWEDDNSEPSAKRAKRDVELSGNGPDSTVPMDLKGARESFGKIESLYRKLSSLFEWEDGPLVEAMRRGDYFLLDEMSLADDAVLERLNSVLEPSRTLVLAEKGGVDTHDVVLQAAEGFRLFATMNPGGDFGKKELSPALRNRFTEIWVPPIDDVADIDLLLQRSLRTLRNESKLVRERMLEYVSWFGSSICRSKECPREELTLSVRDILTWANFVVEVVESNGESDIWDLYVHGVKLMHLDGLGLGTGMNSEEIVHAKRQAELFIGRQVSSASRSDPVNTSFRRQGGKFGVDPFYVNVGSYCVDQPNFHFAAPTTAANLMRILRAMQLRKPVLLEGSPGKFDDLLIRPRRPALSQSILFLQASEKRP